MAGLVLVKGALIHIRLSGFLTLEDLMEISARLRELESGAERSMNRITDMSEVTGSSLDYDTMEQFAATRRIAVLQNTIRSAIFAPSPLTFGLARIFQSINNNPNIEIRLFKIRDSALEWLELNR